LIKINGLLVLTFMAVLVSNAVETLTGDYPVKIRFLLKKVVINQNRTLNCPNGSLVFARNGSFSVSRKLHRSGKAV
jgi:hypothetical protein